MLASTRQAQANGTRPLRVLGFDSSDLRALGTMAGGALVIIPTAAYLLGGVHFSAHDWTPGLDLERLQAAGPVVAAHIAAALIALFAVIAQTGERRACSSPASRIYGGRDMASLRASYDHATWYL